MEKMFCYQCQETAKNTGCTIKGVCGKDSETAQVQDLLIWATKNLSVITGKMRKKSIEVPKDVNHVVSLNLFRTITNANFDKDVLMKFVDETLALRKDLMKKYGLDGEELTIPENIVYEVGVLSEENEDIRSLKELITYGLKGLSAYMKHANVLNYEDEEVDAFLQDTLATLLQDDLTVEELIGLTLKTGEYGVKAMDLLDRANTGTYGNPEMTAVNLEPGDRPGILVSGHDLRDLEMLLEQSKDAGIDIYTHSEMLPANSYPELKKYPHLKGNYGSSWWHQKEDFEDFGGPILMTTNCIVPPKDSYKHILYTTGSAGYPGCPHIDGDEEGNKDFSEIINVAKTCPSPKKNRTGVVMGGFAHNQVIALADKVVEAVKSGAIKKFFVMGGCDGRQKGREYYTEFAKALPKDTVILTAGCAKYRYNMLDLGDIGGIPRVLDAGQCNDSYSLVRIALALKDAFELDDINDLPIAYNIAWYEQKAVIVLLALLSLGVKNIHLGPTLPAFLSPNVVDVLVKEFGIAPNTTVEEDLALFLA